MRFILFEIFFKLQRIPKGFVSDLTHLKNYLIKIGSAVGSALAEHLELLEAQNSAKAEATDSKLLLVAKLK